MTITELKQTAVEVRKGIVTATHAAKSGHPGGSLSATEIFTYLYFEEMNIDPKNPKMEDRDRFVLSKGHTAPGLYSALANRGYFPVKDLETGRVYISSQNHGYAVDNATISPEIAEPAFINVNDGTNEGLKYTGKNIFTVQYHPEACPGPLDSGYLFDRFLKMMEVND
jgi:transketolase N-terminal domain/subunit